MRAAGGMCAWRAQCVSKTDDVQTPLHSVRNQVRCQHWSYQQRPSCVPGTQRRFASRLSASSIALVVRRFVDIHIAYISLRAHGYWRSVNCHGTPPAPYVTRTLGPGCFERAINLCNVATSPLFDEGSRHNMTAQDLQMRCLMKCAQFWHEIAKWPNKSLQGDKLRC